MRARSGGVVGERGGDRSGRRPRGAGRARAAPAAALTATLLLEQGVDLVVIKELLSHAHIGVTAGVYAHVRLRLQRQAIDTLGGILSQTDAPEDPPTAAVVR